MGTRPPPKSFCERIVFFREAAGLSQEELAGKMGKHVNTVGRWERSEQEPPIDTLKNLAGNLGVSLAKLLGEDGAPGTLTRSEPIFFMSPRAATAMRDAKSKAEMDAALDIGLCVGVDPEDVEITRTQRDALLQEARRLYRKHAGVEPDEGLLRRVFRRL